MTCINLGIIGAGLAVEQLHWPALKQLADSFQIGAVCDIDPAAVEHIAELVGGTPTRTTNYREVLDDPRIDAVLLSLPIHLNAEFLRAAADAGKHVICEKPLAANLEQAEALVAALRHVPTVICIAENFHYRDDLKQIRRWMDDGLIGTVVVISILAAFWSDPAQGFASTPWRQDHQYRGAVIADGGVHHAAALRELGGEIEQLHAFIKDVHPVMNGADSMVLNIRYRSGALGQMLFSGAVQRPDASFDEITVYGSAGSITARNGKVQLFRPNHEPETYTATDSSGYLNEFRNFHAAITRDEPIVSTLAEALADWRIIMRALDSAESRNVVLL